MPMDFEGFSPGEYYDVDRKRWIPEGNRKLVDLLSKKQRRKVPAKAQRIPTPEEYFAREIQDNVEYGPTIIRKPENWLTIPKGMDVNVPPGMIPYGVPIESLSPKALEYLQMMILRERDRQ